MRKLNEEVAKIEGASVPKREFNHLKSRFDIFSDVENVKVLRDYFLPKIDKFAKHIDAMFEDNDKVK